MMVGMSFQPSALARPYSYPAVRYMNTASQAMGGVTLPIADEVGNSLFNNPAALARNTKFRSEFLNLNIDANSNVLGNLGLSTTKMTGLSGMASDLNQHTGQTYSAGLGNLTALQWGGLAVGILFQEHVRAVSDGTNIQYETSSQFVPAVGYGLALARGVVRLGYSLQYVNQAYGVSSVVANGGSPSFLSGLKEGRGLAHSASVNFVFPFTYLPTFSLLARNLMGTHYVGGNLLARAKDPVGIVADDPMSIDAAFNFMVRVSGATKSYWYFQYKDLTSAYSMPFLERLNMGFDLGLSQSFDIRAGFTGSQFSAGIGFRSQSSEINLAWYHEPNPLSGTDYWDTRYSLQYKIYFQDSNSRDRDSDLKAR